MAVRHLASLWGAGATCRAEPLLEVAMRKAKIVTLTMAPSVHERSIMSCDVRTATSDACALARRCLVEELETRGITDEHVLAAMGRVPRDEFVSARQAPHAYDDGPLPIGEGQTISQPYVVALMTEALQLTPTDRVLEIGTGSGYAAAVLAEIAAEVYTIERVASLAESARRRLAALGYDRVHVRHGDGTRGWPAHAPYDGIVVTAGGPSVPRSLLEQLAVGARLVMPVGRSVLSQRLIRVVRRAPDDYASADLGDVAFVPLIGAEGWPADGAA
jgi:protein-L-isoaspartate(D-aspartate) O-methyltransferase